jgi:acyl-CoA synthetase (AMP-forming)/AMP-acid ligase II
MGQAHPRLGQVPRAEIVLDDPRCDLEALRSHCARALSPYKVPVSYQVVPAIPRTAGGKVLRRPPDDGETPLAGEHVAPSRAQAGCG